MRTSYAIYNLKNQLVLPKTTVFERAYPWRVWVGESFEETIGESYTFKYT